MGSFAVAGAGAVLGGIGGFFFGGGVGALRGAALGFSVGQLAGNALFPQKLDNAAAPIGDLKITGAAPGTVLPFGVGRVRTAGTLIWAKKIEVEKHEQSQGPGKGGGGKVPKSVSYSYYGSFAIALCEGPVDAVLRIWANGKLIYDANASSTDAPGAIVDGVAFPNKVRESGLAYRFYPGSETQDPDPLILDDKGADLVSAYLGTAYIVFERLPLEGGHLPNIEVELVHDVADDIVYRSSADQVGPTIASAERYDTFAVNPFAARIYTTGSGINSFIERDAVTLEIVHEVSMSSVLGGSWDATSISGSANLYFAHDKRLYFAFGDQLYQIDPVSWTLLGQYEAPLNVSSIPATIDRLFSLAFSAADGLHTVIIAADYIHRGDIYFFDSHIGAWLERPIDGWQVASGSGVSSGGILSITFGRPGVMQGDAWVLSIGPSAPTDTLYIDQITSGIDSFYLPIFGSIDTSWGDVSPAVEIPIADIDGAATAFTGGSIVFDEADGSLICVCTVTGGSNQHYAFKWSPDDGIVWTSAITGTGTFSIRLAKVSGGALALTLGGDTVVKIDAATGAVTEKDWTAQSFSIAPGGIQAYSHDADAILTSGNTPAEWRMMFLDRQTSQTSDLATYVTKVMDRVSVDAADYDVTDIEAVPVDGLLVSQRVSAAAAISNPISIHQIDMVERDGKIWFQQRGGAVVATIPESDMIRTERDQRAYQESYGQEFDVPAEVSVSYYDYDLGYQQNTQNSHRVRGPAPVMYSDNPVSLQFGGVMDKDLAAQIAERHLFDAEISRRAWRFRLPLSYLRLDIADPVTLSFEAGRTARGRITQWDIGADYSIQATVTAEVPGQHVSEAVGATSDGIIPQTIGPPPHTLLFILDVPLLRPLDDIGTSGSRLYWAAAPYVDTASWLGARLEFSRDGQSWEGIDLSTHAATWGHIDGVLPDGNNTFATEYAQSIEVVLPVGGDELGTITELAMANGGNAAAVFKRNGEIEVIQFLEVEDLGSRRYRLTGLNRGVRGTDTQANDHEAGERILMLRSWSVSPIALPIDAIDQQVSYRAVSVGQFANAAEIRMITPRGRDKKPWAPVQVEAVADGADIDITWVRRSRIRGELASGTGDVPLGEASEQYEVDVIDTDGETVLRTLTATSPAVTYSAADISTDFGSMPTEVHLAVYQISSIVGRGFGRVDPVEVT